MDAFLRNSALAIGENLDYVRVKTFNPTLFDEWYGYPGPGGNHRV